MQSYYTLIALDLARERAAEADRHRLVAGDLAERPDRSVRHAVAAAMAALSRASGRIAHRLDESIPVLTPH
jgi:hypothetical protein